MRIDQIQLQNFRCFETYELDLNPRFTLLVGENGSGKTTLLDALAVAAGVWLVKPPDSTLAKSGRNILPNEIRLRPKAEGDRVQLFECKPVSIKARGEIGDQRVEWLRQIRLNGSRTSYAGANAALKIIDRHFARVQDGEMILTPVVAYYGAGRSLLPSRDRSTNGRKSIAQSRRWEAFHDCFKERIRLGDLQNWFQREAIMFAVRGGTWRPGYTVVKSAILQCIPYADDLWYDGDRSEIAVSIGGKPQAFTNLSAGQRMMVALVADIAIKMVTQNAFLVPQERRVDDGTLLPEVLQQTPGLILIDEVDVHLHPKWQRRVVDDLKKTFPSIQFVCTSHSPFIIQSLERGELRALDRSGRSMADYADRSIEDIAEEIQEIATPQRSIRAQELSSATEKYFALLQKGDNVESEVLNAAEAAYRRAAERYSANPGLNAILKLNSLARKAERST